MTDKKLSDFGVVQQSDVSDLVVLYLDGNNTKKNGRFPFSTFISALALLSANNTFTGTNTFSGDAIFSGTATFNNALNASITGNAATATNATNDGNGNNIATSLSGKLDSSKIQQVSTLPASPDSTTLYLIPE